MTCEIIKRLRAHSGLTQSELAKRLGITRSSVNAWEMGISIPSTQLLMELAYIFRVSTDYLLGVDREETVCLSGLSTEEKEIIYRMIMYFDGGSKWHTPR